MNLLLYLALFVQSVVTVQTFGSPTKPVSVIEDRISMKDFVGIVAKSSGMIVTIDHRSLAKVGITTNQTFRNVNKQNVPARVLLKWIVNEVSKTNPNIVMIEKDGMVIIQGK